MMKCEICGKKVAECPPGGDERKFCQGHDIFERREFEKGK